MIKVQPCETLGVVILSAIKCSRPYATKSPRKKERTTILERIKSEMLYQYPIICLRSYGLTVARVGSSQVRTIIPPICSYPSSQSIANSFLKHRQSLPHEKTRNPENKIRPYHLAHCPRLRRSASHAFFPDLTRRRFRPLMLPSARGERGISAQRGSSCHNSRLRLWQ